MVRALRFSDEAKAQLAALEKSPATAAVLKQVRKALGYLQQNPAHPGLHTHEFTSLSTPERRIFESYAQNQSPGAYRIFWRYGPDEYDIRKKRIPVITIAFVIPHPA
jgi:hypothetical protein